MKLHVNGSLREIPDAWADEALVVVLREVLGLVGTKLGCGTGECGCCVIHVDGRPVRSCTLAARDAGGHRILTIEGIGGPGGALHPVQQAWLDEGVSQCGFCQAGQIMEAVALLDGTPDPKPEDLDETFATHPCRCGTQLRIRRAVIRAARRLAAS